MTAARAPAVARPAAAILAARARAAGTRVAPRQAVRTRAARTRVARARVAHRVATRGSVAVYVTPVVAIFLGVTFRDETVAALALVGMALVLLGAWLTSRAEATTG